MTKQTTPAQSEQGNEFVGSNSLSYSKLNVSNEKPCMTTMAGDKQSGQ
jgi:hypothetical protein